MCLCSFPKHFQQLVGSQRSDCFFFKYVIYFALKIQFIARKPSQEQTLFASSFICWLFWGYLRHIISIISPSINKCLWDQDSWNALPIRAYYRPDTALWLQCLVFLKPPQNKRRQISAWSLERKVFWYVKSYRKYVGILTKISVTLYVSVSF